MKHVTPKRLAFMASTIALLFSGTASAWILKPIQSEATLGGAGVAAVADDNRATTASIAAGQNVQFTFSAARNIGQIIVVGGTDTGVLRTEALNAAGQWVALSSTTNARYIARHNFAVVNTKSVRVIFDSKATVKDIRVLGETTAADACTGDRMIVDQAVNCGGVTVGTECREGAEDQLPVFQLRGAATLSNVRLSAKSADGIHCTGDNSNCRLENVVWEDVCEDAASNLTNGGTLTISGGSATNASDKVFQHNSKNSTTVIENFHTYGTTGKLWRSCGDCTNNGGPRYVNISNVTMHTKPGSVLGLNGNYKDKATIRNLTILGWKPPVNIDANGVPEKASSPKVCVEYVGVVKGNGSSSQLGERWQNAICDVKPSDVKAL